MSYDLMVFERTKAPTTKKEFMAWYEKQTEWEEGHDYQTISVLLRLYKTGFFTVNYRIQYACI